jgi:hypothetical protein
MWCKDNQHATTRNQLLGSAHRLMLSGKVSKGFFNNGYHGEH